VSILAVSHGVSPRQQRAQSSPSGVIIPAQVPTVHVTG
jgi:hypothetical protein